MMRRTKGNVAGALALVFLMVIPAVPGLAGEERAVPDITVHVATLASGNAAETLTFEMPGVDQSQAFRLPNGATILSASFDVTGLPLTPGGKSCPENVTIDIGPQLPPEYEFRGKGFGLMGYQSLFSNGFPVVNATLPLNGGTNTTSAIRLPKSAVVSRAVMNVSSGGGLGGSGKVLICGAASPSYNTDIQTKLQSFPDIVAADIIQAQSQTPSLDTLKQYSAVLVFSDYSLADAATLGNNLADYVDQGGGVVIAVFSQGGGSMGPSGRFTSGNYLVMPYNGYQYSAGTLGTYDASHPIMQNVKTFTTNNYRVSSSSVVAGSTVVASFTDGIPIVATRNVNGVDRVDLGFYPPSTDAISSSWQSNTDGKHIIHNALAFTGRRALNASLDILGDSTIEWSNSSFNSTAKVPEFSAMLNSYLATAQPNGTDKYGNEYVDIPLYVTSNMSGMLQLCNLSINYEYTAKVENVKNVGTLTDALSELLPSEYDGKYTNITIEVSTTKPGKVKISNVSIDFRPPIHPPFITSRDPGQENLVMNENSSQRFEVGATDEYGYPLTAVWYLDTLEVARGQYNFTYSADFDSSGKHTVSVTVNNTMRGATATWNITVVNVNRPPVINSFNPSENTTIREEESLNLGVSASDPDTQDTELKYAWYVEGKDQGVAGDTFRFKTDLSSAGFYTIRVKVSDAGGLSATQSWRVTVLNVNVPPVVDKLTPSYNPTIKETESATFTISATDFDKQTLTYRWFVDGIESGAGQQFAYRAGYDAAGTHIVQVIVSDGEANLTRNWTVKVDNVNRPPIPVIDRPTGMLEALDTVPVNFSARSSSDPDGDALRFRWLDGTKELSTAAEFEAKFSPGVHEVTLEVTDSNRATNRTSVKFTVRYVKLVANIERDRLVPVEGDKMTFTAWVNNTGDATASNVLVEFLVDGVSLGTRTVESIAGGGVGPAAFSWKAKKGEHVLTAKIGTQSWSSSVTVEARPAPPAADLTLPMIILAVVAVAVVGGVAFAMSRRKRGPAAADARTDSPPPEAARPPVLQVVPAPVPPVAPAAAPPPVPAVDLEKRDHARKLIISTQEKVADLIENPKDGVDVTAAMGLLDRAQVQQNNGNYDEALRLAKQARASLAAGPAPAAAPAARKDPPASTQGETPRPCPRCGETLEAGWGVCPACGNKV